MIRLSLDKGLSMQSFFQIQIAKIAWRRVLIISFIWTVFSMQGQKFRNSAESIGYGIGHGGTAIALLSVIGAACTKKTINHKALSD